MPLGISLSFGGRFSGSRTNGDNFVPSAKAAKNTVTRCFSWPVEETCTCCYPVGSNVDFAGISSHTVVSSMFPTSCKL